MGPALLLQSEGRGSNLHGVVPPSQPGSPSGEDCLSLLTAEEAEDGGAAGKVPEHRPGASAPRHYLCWEIRHALTLVARCSASGDKVVVVLVWSGVLGGSASCC